MAARLVDLYPLGEQVEILLDEQWQAAQVVQHEYPAVWVKTTSDTLWFVTNGRRIRKHRERMERRGVREEIVTKLLALNQDFYEGQAASFAQSRAQPQPGFARLVAYLPQPCESVLDVGCGEGRFGRFIQAHQPFERYVGVDFSAKLLEIAQSQMDDADIKWVDFYQRDMIQPDFLAGLGHFDVIACLAALHHIPGWDNRVRLVGEMARHLEGSGRLIVSTWQFLDNQRQRRKVRDWAEIGLSAADVEPNDYLLSWQQGGFSYRYACMIDAAETAELAHATDLQIIHQFRSDGKEADLSLYTVLGKR